MRHKYKKDKQFGYLFFIVFLILSLWPLHNFNEINFVYLIISFLFLLLALVYPKILSPLNNKWIKLGELLGKIIAPIIMGLIYFFILTPISLIMKLFGKDILKLKFSKKNSYWIKRVKDLGTMNKQF